MNKIDLLCCEAPPTDPHSSPPFKREKVLSPVHLHLPLMISAYLLILYNLYARTHANPAPSSPYSSKHEEYKSWADLLIHPILAGWLSE
jgi:hypothetical protein